MSRTSAHRTKVRNAGTTRAGTTKYGGDVPSGHDEAQLLADDDVGEGVAVGCHDRKAGPEVVEDAGAEGEARLEVIEDDPARMAQAIEALLRKPQARGDLGSHARRTAEQRFSWDAIAIEQQRMYDDLLKS